MLTNFLYTKSYLCSIISKRNLWDEIFMILLILLGILFFIQLLAASWYDLAKKAADSKNALKHKILCSAVYVAAALLCTAINGSLSAYALSFLVAVALLFIRDIIAEKRFRATEFFSSAFTSVAYLSISVALFLKNTELFGNGLFSSEIRIAVLIAVAVGCMLSETKAHGIAPFISSVYMLINAAILGISLQNSGDAKMQAASCAVIMGASALAVSNGLLLFDKKEKKSLLRINMYYFGLMFISCSIAVL